MKLDFFCRVHTVNPPEPDQEKGTGKVDPPRLPPSIVVIDTETTEELSQGFEFGCYAYCELESATYVPYEEGIFFRDDLPLKLSRVATMPNALPRISVNWPRRVLGSGPAPGLLRTWSGRHCVQVVPGRE